MRLFMRSAVVVSAAAALSLALSVPQAGADGILVGRFNGFAESHALPAVQRGESIFNVTSQLRDRFQGTLMVPIGIQPCWFACDGSVRPNGLIIGSGLETECDFIVFVGRTRAMGDGSVRVASLIYAEFGVQGNLQDLGLLAFTHMQGGAHWEHPGAVGDVSGRWHGSYKPRVGRGGGAITLGLDQQISHNPETGPTLTSAFSGIVHMGHLFLPAVQKFVDLNSMAHGTVGLPAVQTGLAPVGMLTLEGVPGASGPSNGTLGILIGLLRKAGGEQLPAVQGNYQLYSGFFDVFLDVVFEDPTAFNAGSFKVLASPAG